MHDTPSLLAILTHTPVWVWFLFAFVAYMGWQRSQDRVVALWRLLLFPVLMGVLALSGLAGAGLAALPAILVGLVIGGTAGWLMERDGATRRLADGRLWLRGEWWSLVQVVLIVAFRYATGVLAAVNPAFLADPTVHGVVTFVSSLLAALVIARTAARLRVYFTTAPVAA
jgi:hypothetical protein